MNLPTLQKMYRITTKLIKSLDSLPEMYQKLEEFTKLRRKLLEAKGTVVSFQDEIDTIHSEWCEFVDEKQVAEELLKEELRKNHKNLWEGFMDNAPTGEVEDYEDRRGK